MDTYYSMIKEQLVCQLQKVVSELSVDFSALGFYDPDNNEFRWRMAIGSLNDRYKRIVVHEGKGVCGFIFKTKRDFMINRFPEELKDDYDYLDYPILIIEELKSALAVPLMFNGEIIGIALIGQRSYRDFAEKERSFLQKVAEEIIALYEKVNAPKKIDSKKKIPVYKNFLNQYFIEKKKEFPDRFNIIVLDQRITRLSDFAYIKLKAIFDFLISIILQNKERKLELIIENKSDQQMAFQVEINSPFDLTEEQFSYLADEVRQLRGFIEQECDHTQTTFVLNFLFNRMAPRSIWED